MKKTLIALIMVIPLIFMFTIFSAGTVASIGVDIPVSSIKMLNKPSAGTKNIDLAEYQNDFQIVVEVLPVKAKNKEYSFKVEPVEGETVAARVSVNKTNGKLVADGTGKAKISVVSNDGNYTDSFVVIVYSSKVLGFSFAVRDADSNNVALSDKGNNKFEARITIGKLSFSAKMDPDTFADDLLIQSNSDIAVVNIADKTVNFKLSGEVDISLVVENGATGRIVKTIHFVVYMPTTDSGVIVDGDIDSSDQSILVQSKKASFTVQLSADSVGEPTLGGPSIDEVESHAFLASTRAARQYVLTVFFKETVSQHVSLEISVFTSVKPYKLDITFVELGFEITSATTNQGGVFYQKTSVDSTYFVSANVTDETLTYKWVSSGSVAIKSSSDGLSCVISSTDEQEFSVTVSAFKNNVPIGEPKKIEVKVLKNITSLHFGDKSAGLGQQLAIGSKKFEEKTLVDSKHVFDLQVFHDGVTVGVTEKDLKVSSLNDSIAKMAVENGKLMLDIFGTGKVTLKVEWAHNELFGTNVFAVVEVFAVKDGVSVSTSDELFNATKQQKKVVLKENIMLGHGLSLEELKQLVREMPTTFNWQGYVSKGMPQPSVKYVLELKNDLFGNGHVINAENFTKPDSTGSPRIFNGPLAFAEIATAKVAAQDNIVILMRTDGVTLNNAEILGCGDERLYDSSKGNYDLTRLNLTGTVVDVNASVNILNCRIKNGRTVVRVYGGNRAGGDPTVTSIDDVDSARERINVKIEACILSQSREFILKIGTNTVLRNEQNASPALKKENNSPYSTTGGNSAYLNDDYFMSTYVLTDVTLKNSVLMTSGLFTVGMDANFAGPMLNGEVDGLNAGWKNMAGTSFAAVLRLEGDVRLYDWKDIANIDSSSLIETGQGVAAWLKLDMAAMLKEVDRLMPNYGDLFYKKDGTSFVHGGIAYFGGGKNYTQIDLRKFTNENFKTYNINIDILTLSKDSILQMQGKMFPMAAGTEDFKFLLYGNANENSYLKQLSDFADNLAFKGIIPAQM